MSSGESSNFWDELREHTAVSQKASFQFLTEHIFFLTIALYGLPNITLHLHKKRLSERLLEGKAVTLWDELTEHKAVSQKGSCQFLTEDISFFTIALYRPPNITLQIPQSILSERLLEGKAVSLWNELTGHKAVSQKASFQVLTEDVSFFTKALCGLPNITFQIPQEQS